MKIAMMTDTYHPQITGVSVSVDIFREELEKRGHHSVVYAPRYYSGQNDEEDVVRFFSFPYPFKMMRENRISIPVSPKMREFGKHRFDVIHSHVPSPISALAGRLSRIYHIPHVHTYHTLWMQYVHYAPLPKGFSRAAVRYLSHAIAGISDLILCPSPSLMKEIVSYGVDIPMEVLPTGLDLDHETENVSDRQIDDIYGFPPACELLGFVGRLGREKNVSFLFEVLKHVRADGLNPHLVIVGNGPDRERLEREVTELGLREHVTFTGFVPRKRVFALLQRCSLFTFPSMTETQGIVMLEAMSVGTPVVAIDAMGAGDVISDGIGGIGCRPDVGEFSAAVKTLLTNTDVMEAKRKECASKVEAYSAPKTADRLIAIYDRLISRYSNGLRYAP